MGTILVVDDDLTTAGLIRAVLEDDGYRVLHAIGDAGIVAARYAQPGVILLDINMPGMDGLEVSRHLRADPTTVAIPIVCMSCGVTRARISRQGCSTTIACPSHSQSTTCPRSWRAGSPE